MAFRNVLSSLVRSALKPSPSLRRFRKTGSPINEHGTEKLGSVESWKARVEKRADKLGRMIGCVMGVSIGGVSVLVHSMVFADKK